MLKSLKPFFSSQINFKDYSINFLWLNNQKRRKDVEKYKKFFFIFFFLRVCISRRKNRGKKGEQLRKIGFILLFFLAILRDGDFLFKIFFLSSNIA